MIDVTDLNGQRWILPVDCIKGIVPPDYDGYTKKANVDATFVLIAVPSFVIARIPLNDKLLDEVLAQMADQPKNEELAP